MTNKIELQCSQCGYTTELKRGLRMKILVVNERAVEGFWTCPECKAELSLPLQAPDSIIALRGTVQ